MKWLRSLGLLLVLLLAAVVLTPAKAEAADAAINKTNFPDEGFRAYVKDEFDMNKDGKLSAEEAAAVWKIEYYNMGCTSIKGAEYFTDLLVLDVGYNKLTELDLSPFPNICQVWCNGNKIRSLDIHLNKYLVTLYKNSDVEPDPSEDYIFYRYYDLEVPLDDDDYSILEIDKAVKVAYAKPAVKTQPKAQTVKSGAKVTFKVTAKGGGLSYQWYYKKPGGSWTMVSSAAGKKAAYAFTAAARHYGYQYRCNVSNAAGSVYSKAAKLTVNTKPVITSPTKAVTRTAKKGTTVKLTVKADAAETYQWYYRTSSSGSWKAVSASSGKTASYKLTVAKKHNGWQYRCKVTNPYGSVYSKIITLKVTS
ncbi:MAG: immunoglobulin domain-containing protein [Lachnospiraceae bacterium]|nr:immunoglobulin domain-containing protein [Lachnospiraceae bacterium]